MSLWQSYMRASPRTKAIVGAGIITWGAVGLFMSNQAESAFGLTPSQEDERKLKDQVDLYVPKVTTVDKRKT